MIKQFYAKSIAKLPFWVIFLVLSAQTLSAENKFLFWKMESDDGNLTYMLGSIHMGSEEMYPLPKVITDAFDKSEVLVLEVNLNDADPQYLAHRAVFTDGRTLKTEISEKDYLFLQSKLEVMDIPEPVYNLFKPWFAAMLVSALSFQDAGFSANYGIEKYFLDKAMEQDMPIDQLESVIDQIDVFDKLPDSLNSDVMHYLLAEDQQDSTTADNVFEAFLSGDEKKIEDLILSVSLPDKGAVADIISERLIYERNEKMAKKIEQLHSTGKIHFVVVGAAHFVGKRGIIELLKKSGKYKIRKI